MSGSPAWAGSTWFFTADFRGDGKAQLLLQNGEGTTAMLVLDGPAFVPITLGGPGTGWFVAPGG